LIAHKLDIEDNEQWKKNWIEFELPEKVSIFSSQENESKSSSSLVLLDEIILNKSNSNNEDEDCLIAFAKYA
jgi:hypothetical protein